MKDNLTFSFLNLCMLESLGCSVSAVSRWLVSAMVSNTLHFLLFLLSAAAPSTPPLVPLSRRSGMVSPNRGESETARRVIVPQLGGSCKYFWHKNCCSSVQASSTATVNCSSGIPKELMSKLTKSRYSKKRS